MKYPSRQAFGACILAWATSVAFSVADLAATELTGLPLTNGTTLWFHPKFLWDNLDSKIALHDPTFRHVTLHDREPTPLVVEAVELVVDGHWHLRFGDGFEGEFTLPLGDHDILDVPRRLWGGTALPLRMVHDLLTTRSVDGNDGLRFAWADVTVGADREDVVFGQGGEQLAEIPAERSATFLRLVEQLQRHGIVVIDGVPAMQGQVRELASSFGLELHPYLNARPTFNLREFKPEPNGTNAPDVTSNEGLPLHNDHAFTSRPHLAVAFHCIQQSPIGGESLYLDAFSVAEHLRSNQPDVFETLAQTNIRYSLGNRLFRYVAEHRTFELDPNGELDSVTYSKHRRNMFHAWTKSSAAKHKQIHDAFMPLDKLMESSDFMLELKLAPGEMTIIDNARVLHGRKSFGGERAFEGGYLNIADLFALWRSRRALLADVSAFAHDGANGSCEGSLGSGCHAPVTTEAFDAFPA